MQFATLLIAAFTAVATVVTASPTPATEGLTNDAQIDHWLANTDAKITYIGDEDASVNPLKGIEKRGALNTRVVYCSQRFGNTCGGNCSVYNGNSVCLAAPDTVCLQASTQVAFCSQPNCLAPCTQLSNCIQRLDNGFCYTPDTKSIIVPFT
ncbi:hypothetical protein DFP72DRAFT_1169948 [Ephemerocybe angulata]|uniref:Uncharacterized protein n=1 Tax=Ephemerocybe angulata TaxID=980116 RepID=A0A8H6HXV8_9AGAR|nr:hypothetical protein DFP72DRAFT_1169948 [Tulosesus angulatus]